MFSKKKTEPFTKSFSEKVISLRQAIHSYDKIVVGAGAGLSASAGFDYSKERFHKYFSVFESQYGIEDMYSGGFYPFGSLEEFWAYWSRYIYINRFMDAPKPVYHDLLELVKEKDYFVITTNVDHCFQKAGFDKRRLFYTQGDFGLFQCSGPCRKETFDNEEAIKEMVLSQGYTIGKDGNLIATEKLKTWIPSELVPHCPHCNRPMTMNLRCDDSFVEDEGWNRAKREYESFLSSCKDKRVLFLELGVGYNTPVIIKYPFWRMTIDNPKALYVSINVGRDECPRELLNQSILIHEDIGKVLGLVNRQCGF